MAGAEFDAVVGPNGETVRQLAQEYLKLHRRISVTASAQEALTAAQAAANQVIQSIQTPTQRYDAALLRLRQHLLFGRISQEQFTLAVAQAKKGLEGAAEQGAEFGNQMKGTAEGALTSFLEFTQGAENAFGSFVDNAIKDLVRLGQRMLISGLFQALGGNTEGFASGGFLGGGQIGLVGETGPELVMSGRAGLSISPMKLAVGEGGGAGGANVSVTIQAMDAISFQEFVERNEGAIIAPVVKALSRSAILQGAIRR
jgi:hypothetical protein